MPETTPESAVEVISLNKTYTDRHGRQAVQALVDVTLRIEQGAFFGLLGPNGAGKSTLINILAGLVRRTSGTARIWGFDIDTQMRQARRAIGVVPQELNLDPFFTPRELLEVQAGLYGVPAAFRRTDEILDAVGLSAQAHSYARRLSGGMRRRLLVAKALVHTPPVLVLDEPTAGVDIALRQQLWAYVQQLNENGTTVLLTTHYLEEAQALCDTIAIINHGRLIACEPTGALLSRLDSKQMTVTVDRHMERLPAPLERFQGRLENGNRLVFRYAPSCVADGEILSAVLAVGLKIHTIATEETDLEDIFLSLTRAPTSAAEPVCVSA